MLYVQILIFFKWRFQPEDQPCFVNCIPCIIYSEIAMEIALMLAWR